jgi:hypothetical protein
MAAYHKSKDSVTQLKYFQYAVRISIVFAVGTIIWAAVVNTNEIKFLSIYI